MNTKTYLNRLLWLILLLPFAPHAAAEAATRLGFAERVEFELRLERVRADRRASAAGLVAPPDLDRPAAERRVRRYLAISRALETVEGGPITPERLRGETDRISAETLDPRLLAEMVEALDSDPTVIAECLARPALCERRASEIDSNAPERDRELRGRIEGALADGVAPEEIEGGRTTRVRYELGTPGVDGACVLVGGAEWERLARLVARPDAVGALDEDGERFSVLTAVEHDGPAVVVERREWPKLGFEQWWKEREDGFVGDVAPFDAEYDLPRAGTALDAAARRGVECDDRAYAAVVSTGAEIVVWGGFEDGWRRSGYVVDAATAVRRPIELEGSPDFDGSFAVRWDGRDAVLRRATSDADEARYRVGSGRWASLSAGGCTPTPVADGQTIAGTIEPGDCPSRARVKRVADNYGVTALAGQTIDILVTDTTFNSYISLFDARGEIVDRSDFTLGREDNPWITYRAPSSATYVLEVTSVAAGQFGNYSARIHVGRGPTPVSDGAVVNGELSLDDDGTRAARPDNASSRGYFVDSYSVTVASGEELDVLVPEATYESRVRVFRSGGDEVLQSPLDRYDSDPVSWVRLVAQASDTYRVEVTSRGRFVTGRYTARFRVGCPPAAVAANAKVRGELTTDDCMARSQNGAFSDRYTFDARGGQTLVATASNFTFSVRLAVYSSSGNLVAQASERSGSTRLETRLPASDTYLVEVFSAHAYTTGKYKLKLHVAAN